MRWNIYTSQGGYSIIAAIMMIGFLLILTTSTLNLVLQEMQDWKGRQDYIKASAWAEWAMELALLGIKNNGYAYYKKQENLDMLGDGKKDPQISYDSNSRLQSYKGILEKYESTIIPLFWIDDAGTYSLSLLDFKNDSETIHWNILGVSEGLSWIWSFDTWDIIQEKQIQENAWAQNFSISWIKIWDFLHTHTESYLILYNPNAESVHYELNTSGSDYFTHPRMSLFSKGRVGKYTQNLETVVDNTEFLGILRYSLHSWD